MSESRRPLLLGHRGARADKSIQENTFASFDRALADGCDGFEFDVRLTADGQAVICHDPQFEGIEIAAGTTTQLRPLPHLDEILSRYQKSAFLDIELKVSGLETITLELLQKFPPRRGVVISSFLPEVLRTLRSADSSAPLGLICETRNELHVWRGLAVEYLIPHQKLVTAALVHELKAEGKKILVWTVNTPGKMARFRDLGVDGIISDDTEILRRTL
jgi:glycerophosphoryl diester phosphodiesterase